MFFYIYIYIYMLYIYNRPTKPTRPWGQYHIDPYFSALFYCPVCLTYK